MLTGRVHRSQSKHFERRLMKLRIAVLTLLVWIAVNALAVVYPRSLWMDIMFASWMLIMFALAILAAQRTSAAVFCRVVLFVTLTYFAGTLFEPYFWSPHGLLARTLLPFADLNSLGPGAEHTLSLISNKIFFLACCNVSFLLGGASGWFAMLLDRRATARMESP